MICFYASYGCLYKAASSGTSEALSWTNVRGWPASGQPLVRLRVIARMLAFICVVSHGKSYLGSVRGRALAGLSSFLFDGVFRGLGVAQCNNGWRFAYLQPWVKI